MKLGYVLVFVNTKTHILMYSSAWFHMLFNNYSQFLGSRLKFLNNAWSISLITSHPDLPGQS